MDSITHSFTYFNAFLQTKLEAFELQNKFLNKEILELHALRLDDEVRWNELNKLVICLFSIFPRCIDICIITMYWLQRARGARSQVLSDTKQISTAGT